MRRHLLYSSHLCFEMRRTFKRSTTLIKRLLVRFEHHTSLKTWIPPYKLALATGPAATILLLKNIPPRTLINTPYYYNTNTVIPRIYRDAATPYLSRGPT